MTAIAVRATGRHHAPRRPGPLRRLKLRLIARNLREQARQAEAGNSAQLFIELITEASWQGDLARICLLIIGIFLGVTL